MKLFFILALGIFTTAFAQDGVFKARIVDSTGKLRGYRGIRDLSLCGSDLGLAVVADGPVVSENRLKLDCTNTGQEISSNGRFLLREKTSDWPGSEVRTLIMQGPVQNRIDLTIVGDGYTEQEKEKFFEDAQKISDDLFGQDTFATYRALFNVHAVFVPSRLSGIGDGRPKDTALGLYRHPTVRQAVICDDEQTAAKAARLAPDVDYPILVGNDAFYGGLGGEFAITTSAPLNTTTVLRHELGHNFGRVGEEYDGGQVYEGANFSSSRNVSWKHHLKSREVITHQMELIHYSAPWRSISDSDFEQKFQISALSRVQFDFSSLGFDTKDDVEVYVDNVLTPYNGKYNYDRNFYLIEQMLPAGSHSIRFHRKAADRNNIISKLAIYTIPQDFPVGTDLIDAFATYDGSGSMVGYRPTDRVCLMKDMQSHHFCNVCLENMWRNFLREVSLIDSVASVDRNVEVKVAPLGMNRLMIQWMDHRGNVRADLDNKLQWTASAADVGNWTVRVQFVSDEIIDPNKETYTIHSKAFRVQ